MRLDSMSADVTDTVVQRYRDVGGLATILMIGSNARGDQDPSSDIDFMCLFDGASGWTMDVRDGGRHAWSEASKHVEVLFSSFDRVRRLMLHDADFGKPFRLECVVESRVLWGGGDDFDRLKEEASARLALGPPELSDRDLQWEGYEIWCWLERVVAWEDAAASSLRGYQLLERMLELTYALNGKWRPPEKHLLRDLSDIDVRVLSLARGFLAEPNATDISALGRHLASEYGVPLTGRYRSAAPT